jgi:mannan polymerase II complex MNN11 subunit
MHFAYPSRKNSNPTPYRPRSAKIPTLRRSRLKTIAIGGVVILFLIWLFSGRSSKPSPLRAISGKPPVVIITVFDDKAWGGNPEYLTMIRDNREQYAIRHGKSCHCVQFLALQNR